MGDAGLEEDVLRIMNEYADQLIRVESLQIGCDRDGTCDCPPEECRQLLAAQRKMCELRETLCDLLDRLGYVPLTRP